MSLEEEYIKETKEDPLVMDASDRLVHTEEYVTWLEEKIEFLKERLETGAKEYQRVAGKLRNCEGGDY